MGKRIGRSDNPSYAGLRTRQEHLSCFQNNRIEHLQGGRAEGDQGSEVQDSRKSSIRRERGRAQ